MNKLRLLPIYQIHGTDFLVDIEKQVLREADRPANELSFVNDMKDMGTYYLLNYDIVEKTTTPVVLDPLTWLPFEIPPMVELDPEGMAAKYDLTVEALKGKTDFDIIVDLEALAKRHEGILPQIDINGEKFIVDLQLQELRHTEYFFPVLSLKSFDLTPDGWHYVAFYEPIMKQVVNIDPKLTEFPQHIIQVRLPNEIGLDPVATAKSYGMDERELLRRYPIQKDLKAEIIPLSETHIPRLIQQNKEELRRQHEENMRKARPHHRPRF